VHEEGKCVATSERAETESKVIKEAIVLPLELPIWVTKNPLTEPAKKKPMTFVERLKRWMQR